MKQSNKVVAVASFFTFGYAALVGQTMYDHHKAVEINTELSTRQDMDYRWKEEFKDHAEMHRKRMFSSKVFTPFSEMATLNLENETYENSRRFNLDEDDLRYLPPIDYLDELLE